MAWQLELETAEDAQALYVRIADALRRDALRGRLVAGQRLPGARTLAAQLGVHRKTVTAAYDELEAQGWLRTEAARGRFVTDVAPERFARGEREFVPGSAAYALGAPPPTPRPWPDARHDLGSGLPDLRLLPTEALARAYRRVLARAGRRWLDYGPPEGHPRLRAALAEMLATRRGLATRAEDVLVVRGSQMGLWLVARTLLSKGDVVAVESYGYRPAWDAFRSEGASLLPVPVDREGLDVQALATLADRRRLRAVYLTPHHQYPTTALLSAPRRQALLALARRHRLAVIEDDYDHELHYEGRPVLPVASRDTSGSVIYVGTLSKVLAPGPRVGFVVAPPAVLERMARWREIVDRQGDLAVEAAIAELLEEGELQRHVGRMRKAYAARRDALVDAATRDLPQLSLHVPRGGLALWADAAPDLDVEAWKKRALGQGVRIRTAADFTFDGAPAPALRLSFAKGTEGELRDAVRALRRALPRRR